MTRTVSRPASRLGEAVSGTLLMKGSSRNSVVVSAAAVRVPAARRRALTLGPGLEGVAAAAGGGGVRVLDGESAAHQVFLVIDLGAFQVTQAHRVHDHLHAFD